MTIRFELRTTKRTKGAEMVPLHISVSDGRSFRQRQVIGIMINPESREIKPRSENYNNGVFKEVHCKRDR